MQTEFADLVGRKHGLERGIEGSRATHQRVARHYGALQRADKAPEVEVPEPTITERVNPRAYGERVAQSVIDQVQPERSALQARAATADADRKRAAEMTATAKATQIELVKAKAHVTALEKALSPFRELHGLSTTAYQKLMGHVQQLTSALRAKAEPARTSAQGRSGPAHKKKGPER